MNKFWTRKNRKKKSRCRVKFVSIDYSKIPGIIAFSASCITQGHKVGIWLNSIAMKKKRITNKIANTIDLLNKKTFTSRHNCDS